MTDDGITKVDAEKTVNAFPWTIAETLKSGDKVTFTGFIPIVTQASIWSNVSVQRFTGYPQFLFLQRIITLKSSILNLTGVFKTFCVLIQIINTCLIKCCLDN